jgi:hypothetical protein
LVNFAKITIIIASIVIFKAITAFLAIIIVSRFIIVAIIKNILASKIKFKYEIERWGWAENDYEDVRLANVSLIRQNPDITKEEIAGQLNITLYGVNYHIRKFSFNFPGFYAKRKGTDNITIT